MVADLSIRDNIVLALQAARGWARPLPRRTQGRAGPEVDRRPRHPPANPDALVAQPLRRQPAEGAARPVAGHRARAADPRRADPRHRRRRQGPDPEARRRAGRRRAWRSSSSRPSSRRCCASATASSSCRTAARSPSGPNRRRHAVADVTRDHRERARMDGGLMPADRARRLRAAGCSGRCSPSSLLLARQRRRHARRSSRSASRTATSTAASSTSSRTARRPC